jgi:hypothetical protein
MFMVTDQSNRVQGTQGDAKLRSFMNWEINQIQPDNTFTLAKTGKFRKPSCYRRWSTSTSAATPYFFKNPNTDSG